MSYPSASSDLDGSGVEPPFEVRRPPDGTATPVIYASPHSGRLYPRDMMAASTLGLAAIRRSEDAFVDTLVDGALAHGATLIAARYARAYVDLNRDASELDPSMFEDEIPPFARTQTPRVAAGIGAIARVVGEGQEIYSRKLSFAEARLRIERIHRPYHLALGELVAEAREAFGAALLIDWHSMPSAAARPSRGGRAPDFVLGDRFGASCTPALLALVEQELRAMGHATARNAPYAGGYTTERYGAPRDGVHALQVEINRSLYIDERSLEPSRGFEPLKRDLDRLSATLARDWPQLV